MHCWRGLLREIQIPKKDFLLTYLIDYDYCGYLFIFFLVNRCALTKSNRLKCVPIQFVC
jgi:hypothetical protein